MKLVIVGTGYVGLVTGTCFAEMGHSVSCLDIDAEKIANLKQGILPIYEPGLEELVRKNVQNNRLQFFSDYSNASGADAYFIAVPTPSRNDGSCDLSYVETAARQIAACIDHYCVIVNKSTVPVGTADLVKEVVQDVLAKKQRQVLFDVVSNPEFLKEGAAVEDCLKPDRVVIGSTSPKAMEILKEIYRSFSLRDDQILCMDTRSAEMTKYAANAMLATRISFMNEIADICKKTGANINNVRMGIGSDSRIGPRFLNPGVGYGGSCFPKDIRALIDIGKKAGAQTLLLTATDLVNQRQKELLGSQIAQYFSSRGGLAGKTIAIWGLAFKPDTDDMREAPSLTVIPDLLKQGATVKVFDPIAMERAKKQLEASDRIIWSSDPYDAAAGTDAIALLTEWKLFQRLDFNVIQKSMKGIALFDGRNQYNPKIMQQQGFDYISIGVPDYLQKECLCKTQFS